MSAGRLLLIRHGRTAGNGRRYVGWEDVPLDEAGRAQADALAAALNHARIDAIYSSPLRRARDTAAPLAQARGLAVVARDELREIDYGALQGCPKDELRLRLRHDYREARLPGGESLRDVYERAARLGAELAAALYEGAGLAVVGHFWSLRMLAGAMLGLPLAALPAGLDYKPANGSVAELLWGAAQRRLR